MDCENADGLLNRSLTDVERLKLPQEIVDKLENYWRHYFGILTCVKLINKV